MGVLNEKRCKWKGWAQDDACDDLDDQDYIEYDTYDTYEEWLKQYT
jgi:hypothetical protein